MNAFATCSIKLKGQMWFSWLCVIWICFLQPSESQRVINIGNSIKASVSGVDVAGTTFLMNDAVLTQGVVFAYSAFFRTQSPVRFQIWRPSSNDASSRSFMLVSEMRVIPAVEYMREDIYVESRLTKKCTKVETGDRLGIFFEESPGAIAYTFDKSQPTALAYSSQYHNITYSVNDSITFDTLTFPYDFSASAHIDTDLTQYPDSSISFPDCPRGLLIPGYTVVTLAPTTSSPPVTGRPGQVGATGQQGATGATGPVGPTGLAGAPGINGRVGATGQIGVTGYIGATGLSGPEGKQGATGPLGPKGDKGAVGPPGPPGPPGNAYNSTTSDPPAGEVVTKDGIFSSPLFIMILLIWLIVVTVFLVVLVAVLLVRYCRKRNKKEEKEGNDSGSWQQNNLKRRPPNSFMFSTEKTPVKTSSPNPVAEDTWLASMKEESESSYSMDTIEERANKKKKSSRNNKNAKELPINNNNFSKGGAKPYGCVNNGTNIDEGTPNKAAGDSSVYQNLDISKYELTNY